jgi:peptidoglycan/LPS O-acetylase OafA/YrhL
VRARYGAHALNNDATRIAGLDGLRAFAVIAVVLTHAGLYKGHEDAALLPLVHGITGVRVFFVLSGFLITRLLLQEFERSGRISYANFIARRALRIFPLYYLFLLLVTLFYGAGWWHPHGDGGLPYAWLYSYNFVPSTQYDPLLAHTWSLAVEEHFYLLWPLALVWLMPRVQTVLRAIVLAATACLLSYVVIVRGIGLHTPFPERMTFVAAFSLFVGCYAAVLVQQRAQGALVRWCRSPVGLIAAAALFAMPTLLHVVPSLADRVLARYFAVNLQSLAVAALLIWLLFHQRSSAVAWLEARPLRYVGTISYGIYVWQGFFLGVSPDRAPGEWWPPSPLVGLIGVAVLAPLSYHLYERRFLLMKRRFAAKVASSATTRSSAQGRGCVPQRFLDSV